VALDNHIDVGMNDPAVLAALGLTGDPTLDGVGVRF